MASKFGTGWQKIQQHPVRSAIILGVGLLGIILLVAFIGGYFFHWDWTGFNSGTSQITITRGTPTSTSKVDYTATVSQPSKSLWDWLNLLGVLAIPAAVGLGTIWFTRQQAKVSDAENKDNQRETALQAYIDKMSELLLEKQLRDSAENEEVRKIARVRTLTVLHRLDEERKRSVLLFLFDAGLIYKDKNNIVNLSGADLREVDLSLADLREVDLSSADLSGATLIKANLSGADLREANLQNAELWVANLSGAHLNGADLSSANLSSADLRDADLSGASLNGADLSGSDLSGYDLSGANLKGATGITIEELEKVAKSLKGATMPDGSKHP